MGIIDNQQEIEGHRLINTKYPPIALFDDVADVEDFEILYAIQELTNPRLKDQIGDISLLDKSEIPFHCTRHRSYVIAPFVHISPIGGRFNDGYAGALYIADNLETAMKEVKHHQQRYWSNIKGLAYDRILFRQLIISHQSNPVYRVDDQQLDILNPDNYLAAQQLARNLKTQQVQAIQYPSVRNPGNQCWALLTPKSVCDVIPSALIEMFWTGERIEEVSKVSQFPS